MKKLSEGRFFREKVVRRTSFSWKRRQNDDFFMKYCSEDIQMTKFEDQDFKLRKSKKTVIANNQDIEQKDYAGTIIDIDYKKKEVLLKRGTSQGILPAILSIGPDKPRPNTKLISNTYKFIDTLIGKENKYKALNDFLDKKIDIDTIVDIENREYQLV